MNICVYGSASDKINKCYIKAVEDLGVEIAKRGMNLVFGAGGNGLMGAAARGVMAGGGHITGIIPEFFRDEKVEAIFDSCDTLILTKTMHERKAKMEELADAFIITPGGIGTFEEFFEILTLKQLRRHDKPIAIYNINGYYDTLEEIIYYSTGEKFIKATCKMLYMNFTDIDEMFSYIMSDSTKKLSVHDLKDG